MLIELNTVKMHPWGMKLVSVTRVDSAVSWKNLC